MTVENKRKKRPFLGIYFKCCHVYQRLYLNREGTAFVGYCPKCAAKSMVKVGAGGSKSRFYTAE